MFRLRQRLVFRRNFRNLPTRCLGTALAVVTTTDNSILDLVTIFTMTVARDHVRRQPGVVHNTNEARHTVNLNSNRDGTR